MGTGPKRARSLLLAVALIAALVAVDRWLTPLPGLARILGTGDPAASNGKSGTARRTSRLDEAIANRETGVVVEGTGEVVKVLPDDDDGSRHQRFIIEIGGGRTLLVAHNIDLAPRIPLGIGDRVVFRGQFEWNDKGGVIHWTHHDPRGRRRGGYIELGGRRFQ